MQFFAFVLLYPLLWIISILPFRLLYLLSDFVYVILYKIIGYRKKVVRKNLLLVFPNKSNAERLDIEKKSYHHLCDMFLEMIKTMSISEKEIKERFAYKNIEVLENLEAKGKSIAVFCSHYASYEWSVSVNYFIKSQGYVIYKPLGNKRFDRLVHKIRARFNAKLVAINEIVRTIKVDADKGQQGVFGFASDQSPKMTSATYWTEFLGIYTPVFVGAETLAKKYDMNTLFMIVEKECRGHYAVRFEPLFENVREVPNFEITDKFLRLVEQQIYRAPEFYLWTHNRWKHSRIKNSAENS